MNEVLYNDLDDDSYTYSFFSFFFWQVYLFDLTFKQRPYTFLLPKKCSSSAGASLKLLP